MEVNPCTCIYFICVDTCQSKARYVAMQDQRIDVNNRSEIAASFLLKFRLLPLVEHGSKLCALNFGLLYFIGYIRQASHRGCQVN